MKAKRSQSRTRRNTKAAPKRRAMMKLRDEVRLLKDRRVAEAYALYRGNIVHAARALGVGRAFFYEALKRLGLYRGPITTRRVRA
jgi:DNA-binding NtrC family response regulator